LKITNKFSEEQNLKDKDQKLKEEEQRLKKEEQRLKEIEKRLKEEEKRLKEEEKINLKKLKESEGEEKRKRLNGVVLWFNDNKGYGFIQRVDKEKDIFVHSSAVQNSGLDNLKKDEQLTFEVENSDKGPSAVNLQKTVDESSRLHLKIVK
jgi:CspA family cold shock protein